MSNTGETSATQTEQPKTPALNPSFIFTTTFLIFFLLIFSDLFFLPSPEAPPTP